MNMNTITYNPAFAFKSIHQTRKTDNRALIKNNMTTGVDRLEKTEIKRTPFKAEKMLLGTVKSAINGETADPKVFKGATSQDWNKLMKIANKSAVTCLVYDAVKDLPKGNVPPEIMERLKSVLPQSENQHMKQEKVIGELTDKLGKKGIDVIQMKGIGFSMNYPIPQHRFGGDIDIFTRKKGTVTDGYSNTWEEVNKMMMDEGWPIQDYKRKHHKHSEIMYKGMMVENHNYFLNKERIPEADKIDKYLHKVINPHEQILPNGTKILVPSKEFNGVFMAHHAFQHFVYGGIDVHNMADWAIYLKKNGLNFPKELKGTRFEKFVYAFTNVTNKCLGTNIKVPENKDFETKILKRIVSPEIEGVPANYNKLQTLVYKTKRLYHRAKFAKEYTGYPIRKVFRDSVFTKLANPKSIFNHM